MRQLTQLSSELKKYAYPYGFWLLMIFIFSAIVNPFYLHQELNLFELGLYLPGIQAILDGQVPYRDFFHLRGPLELWLPAWLMALTTGVQLATLMTYFYLTTFLCIIIAVWMGSKVIPSRWLILSLAIIEVSRTFPRICYTHWGGMRYLWGWLALICLWRFIKARNKRWLVLSGVMAAAGLLTSIEIGLSVVATIGMLILLMFFYERWHLKDLFKSVVSSMVGFFLIIVPFIIYMTSQGALLDYVNAQWVVVTNMEKTFIQLDQVPKSLMAVISGMLHPEGKNFRHLTPAYTYIFFAIYYIYQWRHRRISWTDQLVLAMSVYALMIYATGFRNLWTSVFEMSLQPQKVVFFYLTYQGIVWGLGQERWRQWAKWLLIIVVISSLGYGIDRYRKRFFGQLWKHQDKMTTPLTVSKAKGVVVPAYMADDIHGTCQWLEQESTPQDHIFMLPELGTVTTLCNRYWPGKFPLPTLAWMSEAWLKDYMTLLNQEPPKFAVMNKKLPDYFALASLATEENKQRWQMMVDFVERHYRVVGETSSYNLYQLK